MKKMSKDGFDNIIRKNIIEVTGRNDFGYVINGKLYESYYKKDVFEAFVKEMEETEMYSKYYKTYYEGKGNELIEKNSRYGMMPPKMASVASSSRFCYLALRDGAKVLGGNKIDFEHECKINGINAMTYPQLDAFIEESNTYIEAKCHEIFTHHDIVMSHKYKDNIVSEFGIALDQDSCHDQIYINPSIFCLNKMTTRFDIKQLLCHLLGIKSEKEESKEATLAYLFFKPKVSNKEEYDLIENIFDELKDEIESIFNSPPIKKFTNDNNIKLNAFAEYSMVMEPLTKDNIISLIKDIRK